MNQVKILVISNVSGRLFMKIAVIGANGMIGSRAIAEALARSVEVDAYSRKGNNVDGAQGFSLDATDTAELVKVIDSHDVTIISTAGRDQAEDAMKNLHTNLIQAAPQGRFIVVGGAGALENAEGQRFYDAEGFPEEYKSEAVKFGGILDEYRENAKKLNWTMLAPAFEIAPGIRTGDYKESKDTPAGNFVSAEDFAVALIDEALEPQHARERFTVASKDEESAQG